MPRHENEYEIIPEDAPMPLRVIRIINRNFRECLREITSSTLDVSDTSPGFKNIEAQDTGAAPGSGGGNGEGCPEGFVCVPEPPENGTYMLVATNGTMAWVETEDCPEPE